MKTFKELQNVTIVAIQIQTFIGASLCYHYLKHKGAFQCFYHYKNCSKRVKREIEITSQSEIQKQPPRGVPRKSYSENMQQIYRRTPMPKCNFNKVALLCNFIEITLRHGCSLVNFLHIFRTPFLKNTTGWLLM